MDWRRANRVIHRDLGYLCVGLTLLYAVTGVLLNHLHDWNPMYSISGGSANVGPLPGGVDEALAESALKRLGITAKPISTFRSSETTLDLYFDGGDKMVVTPATGEVVIERVEKRGLTSRLNELHLNRPRAPWTFIADGYAVALGLLAVSGALLAVRKGSVSKRGVVLTLIGVALAGGSLLFVL